MNTANRARIARRSAQRLGLELTQRGMAFTARDGDITLALGALRRPGMRRAGGSRRKSANVHVTAWATESQNSASLATNAKRPCLLGSADSTAYEIQAFRSSPLTPATSNAVSTQAVNLSDVSTMLTQVDLMFQSEVELPTAASAHSVGAMWR